MGRIVSQSEKMKNMDSSHQRVWAGSPGQPGKVYLLEKLTLQSTCSVPPAAATTQWGWLEQTALGWINLFKLLTGIVFSLLRNQAAYWLSCLDDVIPLRESWGQWTTGSDYAVRPHMADQRLTADHCLQFRAGNRTRHFTSNHTVYKLQIFRKVLISHTKAKRPWRLKLISQENTTL